MFKITVNGDVKEIAEGTSLRQVLAEFTPYGEEATIVIQNGKYYRSIDLTNDDISVSVNDKIDIVPLIIGG